MLNVLNTITVIHDGGLERHVYYIISFKKNPQLNHFLVVLTKKNSNELTSKYEKLGINIKYFDFDNRLFNIGSIPKNIVQSFKLAYYIKKNKIDIIHTHDFFPGFVSRVSAIISFIFFFHRVKHIFITLHIVFNWLKPIHNFLNRILSKITTKIVCLSESIRQYSLKYDRIDPQKYIIINTAVDTTKFIQDFSVRDKKLSELGYKKDDFILGNIGVLSIRKGQIYLFKAFNILKEKYPFIKLMVIGGERPHEKEISDELYSFIKENNLADRIKIIPPRDDVNLIYNLFDIFVMPSVTEGLSACAIEAMLMERLCLFSDIDPFKELVEDGKQGFLFQNKNVDDLTQKLDYLISNYKSFDSIKKNARLSVENKFDVRLMVSKYENLYLN